MKKRTGAILLVIFLAIIVALGYFSFGVLRGTMHKDREEGVKLGLDLAGGVSITYQVDADGEPTKEDMDDTIYKLQKRVEGYSTEAQVYQVGDDRITVEIPGVSNAAEILEDLGSPGSLSFMTMDGTVVLNGNDVADAQGAQQEDQTTGAREYVVELTLNNDAIEKWATATSENIGNQIAIVYDDEVISAPVVQTAITDGKCVINGMSSLEEANELASSIRIGSLSLPLKELESKVVGAQLGTDAISTSIKAAAIGVLIVMAFMIFIYWIPGLASALALLIYSGIVVSLLHLYDVTLTLPGIAGIILSIGMAVDANVVIFARIREETAAGQTTENAIKIGFKKALSAIVDSNITTLIAAAVLGIFGTGPIRGFAATLAIGVAVSMFTALVITRWILRSLHAIGFKDLKFYGVKKQRKTIDIVKRRLVFFLIPICLIVIGLAGMGVHNANKGNPLNFSLEFMGGTSTNVTFETDYTLEEIDDTIVPQIEEITGDGNVQANKVEDSTTVQFKTRTLSLDERQEFNNVMLESYGVAEEDITYENISSTISSEMRSDAIRAVIIATICMLIYIWFRFKDLRFAGAAVLALVHDVLILLVFYSLSWTSVGTTFIACILTIVGYSINSTIVMFDRVREHIQTESIGSDEDYKNIVNTSITETLSRSINTNITSLITLVCLFILGVSSIREFSGPLIAGIIAGVYSSVFVTGSLWYVFRTKIGKEKNKKRYEIANARASKVTYGADAGKKKKKKRNKQKEHDDKIIV